MDQLDSSPYPDDLREELAVRPAKGMSKLTLALAAGVVLVAGILIGLQAGRLPAPQRLTGGGGYAQQQAPPAYADRQGGLAQRMGGGTIGTVEKVEGGKVYVKTVDGATVTVNTTDQTTVQIATPGKVSDLKAGTTVTVRGRPGDDGSVTAASITQGGPGGGPR